MHTATRSLPSVLLALALAAFLVPAGPAAAQVPSCCVVPDNGSGSATLPPSCPDGYSGSPMRIVDGLPPGSSLDSDARLGSFFDIFYSVGGSLGGEIDQFKGTLDLDMVGTGAFAGYHRVFQMPILNGEMHAAPRAGYPGPVQTFDTDMFFMQGQLPPGDPDFDLLRITAGTGFGLPSPGHTTLTQQPGGTWAVDSFFDITYRIDFVGSPGGPFGGMSGSTTGTVRLQTCPGSVAVEPATWGSIKLMYD